MRYLFAVFAVAMLLVLPGTLTGCGDDSSNACAELLTELDNCYTSACAGGKTCALCTTLKSQIDVQNSIDTSTETTSTCDASFNAFNCTKFTAAVTADKTCK